MIPDYESFEIVTYSSECVEGLFSEVRFPQGCSSQIHRRSLWYRQGRSIPRAPSVPFPGCSLVPPGLSPSSCPYSPKCVEGLFSEICIQRCAYNAASEPKGSILNASTLGDRLLHVGVLDRFTGSRMLHCHARVGSDHARFLPGFALAGKRRR
jgi:hypothetical protein